MKQTFSIINKLHFSLCLMLCIYGMLIVFTSCSKEENISQDTPLSFSFGAIDETRASSRAYEAYTGTEFGVYAKLYRPEYVSGTVGQQFMTNEKVTYNGSYCDTENTYYWVNGDTHFSAYSPYMDNPENANLKVTLPATPYAGYRYEGVVDGRTDYMFSDEQMGGYEDFTSGSVPVIFHHALTKVDFSVQLSKVQEGSTTWSFDVVSLQLVNLRNQGNVSFTHDNGAVNTWKSNTDEVWETKRFPLGSTYEDNYLCNVTVNEKPVYINNTLEHAIGETLYLMPQLLNGKDESEFVQSLILEYTQYTTKGGVTKSSNKTVTIPLRTAQIAKWGINRYVKYKLILEPAGSVTLAVDVQPWELDTFENEFSNIVTVNNDGKIVWTEGSYAQIDDDKVVLLDDISTPAEFTFNIAGPLGGTWQAFFITNTGSSNAFTLSQIEGPVGTPCTITIKANSENTSNVANQAELCFAVLKGSSILPVDALTSLSGYRNYTIVQNINK